MTRSKHARFMVGLLVGILSLALVATAIAQETSTLQRKRKPATPLPAAFSRILFSEGRVQIERPELVMDVMKLKDGDVVADIGAGPGFYSLPVARRIGPHGVVFAVDIQKEMLDQLRERMDKAGVTNIYPVLGELDDPNLPPGKIDWILLVDAYHEFGEPEAMLARMRKALAPDGRVMLLEYRGEPDPDAPPIAKRIPRDHKMSIAQVMSEWVPGGFELVQRHDFLPAEHMFIFKKGEVPTSSGAWHENAEVAGLELDGVPNLSAFGSHVYFAGQPDEAAFETFAKRGVKTVINLRTSGEMDALDFDEAAAAEASGMDYLHVPVGREPLGKADLDRIAAVLNGAGENPVLLHCRSSNRVGFVWSIFRAVEHGLGLDEALAEGKSAGMRAPQLEQRARDYIESQSNQ